LSDPSDPPRVTSASRGEGHGKEGQHRSSARRHRQKRRLPRWLTIVGWVIIALLGIVAIMRIVAWDDFEPFALMNTVTAFVYLPAWIVAIATLLGRRFALGATALLIVGAQIAFLLPEITAAQPVPRWASHAQTIRLLDANVYFLNPSMAGYVREIKAFKPQLVTMEEATPLSAKALEHSSALRALPYHLAIGSYDAKAFFIASKYPLRDERMVSFQGTPLLVQTVLQLPSGPLTLWVVHTDAPLTDSFQLWKSQLSHIAKLIAARRTNNLLVVGDFNATWGNKGFRDILDASMTDGAAARGHAFEMTWTQTRPPLPPFVRIDHVLTGSGVAVTTIRTDHGPGSDHRDLMATVAIRR
jgi:endonuclease/exonuclease/phosphatase (EEP) superfamily protein YafD